MTVNTQEFYRELEQLTELGYLERPQLDRIRDEYLKTRKERHNIFLIFALRGVVLSEPGSFPCSPGTGACSPGS